MSQAHLQQFYREQVVPELKKSRTYRNIHEVPRVEKIVVNSGFDAGADKNQIEEITKELSIVTGQKAIVTKARMSVSNFKLRAGMPIGVKVTLRGRSMYEFLYRLLAVALPGIRDFRGVPDKLDGQGNYTLGINDHTIFPEAHHDTGKHQIGMDICIVTSAKTDDEGRELLRLLGMPFRKRTTSTAATA
jgi:large subunit ribosomal protein L5